MNIKLIDILPTALFLLLLWRVKPVKPIQSWNENYLSLETCKSWRGFFAVVVVLHHLSQLAKGGVIFYELTKVGILAVAVFFFFSGYGLQKKYIQSRNYQKRFLLRRLPTVLFPYIIITAVYWLVNAASGTAYSPKDIFIKTFVKGDPIVSYSWYIIVILMFYIVFAILMIACRKPWIMIMGGCVWYGLYITFCMKMKYGIWWYNTAHLLIIGMLWAAYEDKITAFFKKSYRITAPLIWTAFVLLFYFSKKIQAALPIPNIRLITETITCLLFVLSLLLLTLKFEVGNPVLNQFGTISLEIYLVQGLFVLILHNDSFVYIQNDLLFSAAVIFGSILLAFVFHLFNRKMMSAYQKQINYVN